jgi:hypothetical protein
MQGELLHTPAGDFRRQNLVFAAAIHGVNGGEFLDLLASFAKFTQHRSA